MSILPISIICSSIRPERWKKICDDFSKGNDLKYEIIFVGPKDTKSKIPPFAKFIKSDLPIAYCFELAARAAKGEYLMPIADDLIFQDYVLDKLYGDYAVRIKNKYVVVSPFFSDADFKTSWIHHMRFPRKHPTSQIVPLCALYCREKWKELGGIDSRFTVGWWDIDLSFRFYEAGGSPFIAPDCPVALAPDGGSGASNGKESMKQKQFLQDLWTEKINKKEIKIRYKRKLPVKSIKF